MQYTYILDMHNVIIAIANNGIHIYFILYSLIASLQVWVFTEAHDNDVSYKNRCFKDMLV